MTDTAENDARPEPACGLCGRDDHDDDTCPSNPATWPIPPVEQQEATRG